MLAYGGVTPPMAVFTPMMAAKWMGETPMACMSGSSSGAVRMMAVTSLTIMPMKKSSRLMRISSTTLFWVMPKMVSTMACGICSMTKIWLSMRLKTIMIMIAPTAVAELLAASRKLFMVRPL